MSLGHLAVGCCAGCALAGDDVRETWRGDVGDQHHADDRAPVPEDCVSRDPPFNT